MRWNRQRKRQTTLRNVESGRASASSTGPVGTISEHSTVVAVKDLVSADLADEVVMLHLQSGVYYGLDAVGVRIWEMIQEPRTVSEIRSTILEEFDVAPDRCQQEMLAFLQDLAVHDLIQVTEHAPDQ